jgi:purine nucleosidase
MDKKVSILLDTDIGSDIDDAVCLAYLLSQTRCELVGITTVTGQAMARAMLADALCRAAGRDDVPIHPGAETPILVEQKQPNAPQSAVLERWEHREDFKPNTAVAFMRDVIHSRPGEITLLAIGALTNVGLLFTVDREIPRLLRQMVLMCGVYTNRMAGAGPTEWNATGDPHATAIVFNARVQGHTSVGLEVTSRCRLEAEECHRQFRGGALNLVADMAEVWFQASEKITFHDPLAAAVIFEPEICQYQDGLVEVELKSDRLMGMTHWNPESQQKPHRIAIEVDPQRFFAHYFGVVRG